MDEQGPQAQTRAPSSYLHLGILASALALVTHLIIDFTAKHPSETKPSDWLMDGMVRHVCT